MTGYPSANVAGEDARLTRAAQAGDAAALGLLLELHRARMLGEPARFADQVAAFVTATTRA
jgi:hypothetical protein